jgi:hypothetical protein
LRVLSAESKGGRDDDDGDDDDGPGGLTVVIHPAMSRTNSGTAGELSGGPRALWRKREVVRQERTVHYTTVDADGETQELVERETTQTEVLHMECRETGEFAHRETTKYEQVYGGMSLTGTVACVSEQRS